MLHKSTLASLSSPAFGYLLNGVISFSERNFFCATRSKRTQNSATHVTFTRSKQ